MIACRYWFCFSSLEIYQVENEKEEREEEQEHEVQSRHRQLLISIVLGFLGFLLSSYINFLVPCRKFTF